RHISPPTVTQIKDHVHPLYFILDDIMLVSDYTIRNNNMDRLSNVNIIVKNKYITKVEYEYVQDDRYYPDIIYLRIDFEKSNINPCCLTIDHDNNDHLGHI